MALNETQNGHYNFQPYTHNQNHASQHHANRHSQFKWEMSNWSECNNLCDGEQYRTAVCIQADDGRSVSPNYCRDTKPDDEYQTCNVGCVVEYVSYPSIQLKICWLY